jgi:hypothetical protein
MNNILMLFNALPTDDERATKPENSFSRAGIREISRAALFLFFIYLQARGVKFKEMKFA